MSDAERSSTLGPALFFGLLIYALATYSPPEVTYANPTDLHDWDETTVSAVIPARDAPVEQVRPAPPLPRHTVRRADPSRRPPSQIAGTPVGATKTSHPAVAGQFNAPDHPQATGIEARHRTVRPDQTPAPLTRYSARLPQIMLPEKPNTVTVNPGRITGGFELASTLAQHTAIGLGLVLPGPLGAPSGQRTAAMLARPAQPGLPLGPLVPLIRLEVQGDNVHLRSGPGVGYSPLTKLSNGVEVTVLGTIGNWRRVLLHRAGKTVSGWMYVDFLPTQTR